MGNNYSADFSLTGNENSSNEFRKIGSSSSKIFKLLLSLVAVSVLVAAVAVGIYLVRRNQDYREGAKGTPSYDLTAVVAYTKDDEIPEIARKTIEKDNPLDYTIVLFQDSLGARFDLNQKTVNSLNSITFSDLTRNSNESFTLRKKIHENENQITSWFGENVSASEDTLESRYQLFLSVNGDVAAIDLFTNDGRYEVKLLNDNYYIIQKLPIPEALINPADDVSRESSTPESSDKTGNEGTTGLPLASLDLNTNQVRGVTSINEVDVLISYSQNSVNSLASREQITQSQAEYLLKARVSNGFLQMNTALVDSKPQGYSSDVVMNRASFYKTPDTTSEASSANSHILLDRLNQSNDGYFDDISNFRSQIGADINLFIADFEEANVSGRSTRYATGPASAIIFERYLAATGWYSVAHELGHIFGADHDRFCCGNSGHNDHLHGASVEILNGGGSRITTAMSYSQTAYDIDVLKYSNPNLYFYYNNNTYQLGASNEYNALAIYERSAIVSNFDEWNLPPAPPGGPQSGGSGGCDVWRATCTDSSQFSEASCSTQQMFNSTWWNSWPGGGYGRWQYEACQNHGGVTTSVCPNQQQDPIRWCVTLDCPNGDTNGDNRCTVDDGGGYTQEYNSGPFCNYPRSGQGDINIYSGGQSQIDWNTYCGTTYKYLTSGSVPTSTPVPTLTPTPYTGPPPTPAAPTIAPNLSLETTNTSVNLSWSTSGFSNGTEFKIERCFGSNCSGYTEIASVSYPNSTYSDTSASTYTSTYRYRVRAAVWQSYGPYSQSLASRVTYNFTGQVVCQNGNAPHLGTNHRMRFFWLKWPPNPQTFQEFLGPVGQTSYTFPITSFNSINNYYIRNVAFIGSTSPGNVFLNAVGNTQYPNDITVSNYFNYPTSMYKITRNTIPGGTSLQLKYYGPPEWCN